MLGKFQGKGITKKITNDEGVEVELKINPLKGKDLELFMSLGSVDEVKKVETINSVAFGILKENFPDATREEYDNISVEFIVNILDALGEVHNIKDTEGNKKLQEVLNGKQ